MSSSESATRDTFRQRPSGMRTFIVIFLALHLPLFIYPVIRLGQWLEAGVFWTLLVLVPVASSQVISRWLLRDAKHRLVRALRHLADFLLGMSPILLMALLVAEILVAIAVLPAGSAAMGVLLFTAAVSLAGFIAALHPVVRTISFSSRQLAKPLRFVQITDVHIGSRSGGFLRRVIDEVRRLNPEFLCITGDFIDATDVPVEELSSLKNLACPVYFSIGNHERYEDLEDIVTRLESLGVEVLRSRAVKHRDDVQVIGIDDRDDALQVERELPRVDLDPAAFKVLMYHRPRGLKAAAAAGIGLMISGHTHNGQIFPFNFVVGRVFDRVVGLFREGTTRLYVSQGTGTWGPVMRVGTRSEITLFEIDKLSAL